jgi:citrate lyase beta subunit
MRPAWLFAPANAARKEQGALASDADVVVLDLEDAVPPAKKAEARAALASLAVLPRRGALLVRVNAAGTPLCLRDLEAAVQAGVDGVMLPKAETAAEVDAVCWSLTQFEAELGRTAAIELVPLIETARGVCNLGRIPWGPRVRQVAFGSVDYALDLGLVGAAGQEAVTHAQFAIVCASRGAGLLPPIDGVTMEARDAAITGRDAVRARALDFGGKLAIHPVQVAPIQLAFRSEDDEIVWANEVVAAFGTAEASGSGAVLVRNRLVDRPVLMQARRVLERAAHLEA